MSKLIELFPRWPYDDALIWMNNAQERVKKDPKNMFIACGDHQESVITLGRNVTTDEAYHLSHRFMLRKIDRGGGITAHEPGQLVLYPVFNIEYYRLSVKSLVAIMEQTMIDFLMVLGLHAKRSSVGPGVFVDEKKIGFVGLRVQNHLVSHGMALNMLNDASIFSQFDPCGIKALPITSARYHAQLEQPLVMYAQMLADGFTKKIG